MSLKPPTSGTPSQNTSASDRSSGTKTYRDTFGTRDQATVAAFIANRSASPTTEVMGVTDPSTTGERGSVSLFADNKTVAPTVDSTATTFTATSVVVAGADLTGVALGMIVDCGAGASPSAVVTGVGNQTVTVAAGWRASGSAAATPTNGTQVRINRKTGVWAHNANVYNEDATHETALIGFELGVKTARDDASAGLTTTAPYAWGVDVVALSSAGRPTIAYNQRGRFQWGYAASGFFGAGFMAHSTFDYTPATTAEAAFYDNDSKSLVSFKSKRAATTEVSVAAYLGTEANPRVAIKPSGIEFGPGGATALTDWLRRLNTNLLGVSGLFSAAAGFGSGDTVAATETIGKAVVKKLPWRDAAGSVVGYIPIYSSIT